MKIKFFKKENNFKKENFQLNANFYWKLIVGCAFILIVTSFFFDYRLFIQVNKEITLPSANNPKKIPLIDQDRLAKDLDYFSEREIKSNQILNSPTPVVDPSL